MPAQQDNSAVMMLACMAVLAAAGVAAFVAWKRGWFSSEPKTQPPPTSAPPGTTDPSVTTGPPQTTAAPDGTGSPGIVNAVVTFGQAACAKGHCNVTGTYTVAGKAYTHAFSYAPKAGLKAPASETVGFLEADPATCAYPCKGGAYRFSDASQEVRGTIVEVSGKNVKVAYDVGGTKYTATVQNPKVHQGSRTVPVSGALMNKAVTARAYLALPSKLATNLTLAEK